MTPRHEKRLRKTTVFCSLLEDLMIEMRGKKKHSQISSSFQKDMKIQNPYPLEKKLLI